MQLFEFTEEQLSAFIKDDASCVSRVPSKTHIGVPPFCLTKLNENLLKLTSKKKVGQYDIQSKGIILCVRNIRLSDRSPHNTVIRHDSPHVHLNLVLDYYVFRPRVDAVLRGSVKHIWKRHVSALIYNVFSVSIRLQGNFREKVRVGKPIAFRVKNFDLQNSLPFIEGELIDDPIDEESMIKPPKKNDKVLPPVNTSTVNETEQPMQTAEATVVTCSEESSSDEEEFKVPVPKGSFVNGKVVIQREMKRTNGDTKAAAQSPSHTTPKEVPEVNSSTDSSSDDEEFKVAIPKVCVVDGKYVIKREMPPPKKNKKSSSASSSASEAEKSTPSVDKVKKKVLQSPLHAPTGHSNSLKGKDSQGSQPTSAIKREAQEKKKRLSVTFAADKMVPAKESLQLNGGTTQISLESSSDDDDEFGGPIIDLTAERKRIAAAVLSNRRNELLESAIKKASVPRKRKAERGGGSAKLRGLSLNSEEIAEMFNSLDS